MGGLGCFVSEMLVRSGIGGLYVVDNDTIEPSNLNRQILYKSKDIGELKVNVAFRELTAINSQCQIVALPKEIDDDFILPDDIFCVVDCVDNYKTRLSIDALSKRGSVYLVHGGVGDFYGEVTSIYHKSTPSFKDIFPKDNSKTLLTFPPVVSVVGAIQSFETLRLICGFEENLLNKMAIFDMRTLSIDILNLATL